MKLRLLPDFDAENLRRLFLSALGLIFVCAFASLAVQILGLAGEHGILPIGEFLAELRRWASTAEGLARVHHEQPTLCWFDASDASLRLQCGAGIVLSLLLFFGVAPLLVLPCLWALYLSLTVAGQEFFWFQWDTLLLETAFFAIWLAPAGLLPWGLPRWLRLRRRERPAPATAASIWALRLLLFRFMFASGYVKLSFNDPHWHDLTALTWHYWTQPLPTPLAWHVHRLPLWFHKASCAGMFAVEMGAPWLLFLPGRGTNDFRAIGRRLFGVATIALMVGIAATGNYGFFLPLTILLALLLFDRPRAPSGYEAGHEAESADGMTWSAPRLRDGARFGRAVTAAIALAATVVAFLGFGRQLVEPRPRFDGDSMLSRAVGKTLDAVQWACAPMDEEMGRPAVRLGALHAWIEPFRTLNTYGLFRVMTTERHEIVVEGSDDEKQWRAYEFRWKPGDLSAAPALCQPHMPRLDWQMWFAPFTMPGRPPAWFQSFLQRLLEGEPTVLALLAKNPFEAKPPKFVRALLYDYRFTTPEQRAATGEWWFRIPRGLYSPAVSLR